MLNTALRWLGVNQKIMSLKPFHESIIDSLESVLNVHQFRILAKLIMETNIPKDHDKIMEAFIISHRGIRFPLERELIESVKASLERQKEEIGL